jgi:hypothetical protein
MSLKVTKDHRRSPKFDFSGFDTRARERKDKTHYLPPAFIGLRRGRRIDTDSLTQRRQGAKGAMGRAQIKPQPKHSTFNPSS